MNKTNLSLAVALLLSSAVYAEDMKELEVVSIATKTAKSIDGISASVEVFTREDIEKVGGESLKDIINRMPGISMQYSGGAGSSGQPKSAISMRGINAKGTLILIDGRRVATEFKKAYDLNRIPASSIERVEIIKGPMSTLYGSDASGGVVNIITKKPKDGETEVDFGVRYGQNGDGDAQNTNVNLGIRSNFKKLRFSAYVNYTTTEPYTQNEDSSVYTVSKDKTKIKKPSQTGKLSGKVPDNYNQDITLRDESDILTYGTRVEYEVLKGTVVGLEVNAFNEEREGTYFAAFSKSNYKNKKDKPIKLANVPIDSKEKNEKLDIGLDIVSHLNDDLALTLRAYNSQYTKESTGTSPKFKDLGYDSEVQTFKKKMAIDIDITSYEGMLNYALTDSHLLTTGFEYRDEERDSFVFKNGVQKVSYKSLYLQDEWEIQDSLNIVVGARYDDISEVDNKSTFKLGVVKNFSKLLNLRGNFAQGYRAPDTKELYVDRKTSRGEQKGAAVLGYNLKPEFTNSYEIGLSGRNAQFSYSTAVFLNQIENQIANVKQTNYFTYVNISKAQTRGIELSTKYKITDNISTGLSWIELQTEDKKTKKDLVFQPDRIVSLVLDYAITKDFKVGSIVKHTGEQYFVETINSGSPEAKKVDSIVESYTSVDVTTAYVINKYVKVYGGVNNILDEEVDEAIGSSVGRYFYLGLRAKY